ncbi:NlpC/P60 family protein [Streptomyces sp. NPDC058572]|uniref:C40 family peptidase n=1 Tax=Streptomyces sp. NPDC058572 TaxID=3346546 RepID=UPI00366988F9
MSGRLIRTVCTAALVAVTAIAAGPASAEPSDEPSPDVTAEAAEAAEAAGPVKPAKPVKPTGSADPAKPAAPVGPAPGAPALSTVSGMLTRLQDLYRRAEEAGEAVNAAEQALTKQRAEAAHLGRALTYARNAFDDSRSAAGQLAREQYRGHSDLSSYLRLLLARDPQSALDQGHLIERAANSRLATMTRLQAGARRADMLATAARKALDKELLLAARHRQAYGTAAARLKAVEEMLASLSAADIAALSAKEESDTAEAQEKLLATGLLDAEHAPSAQGSAAMKYAVQQIGKPYVSGAEGPDTYDGSGLTSQAWAKAGRTIPRTSQEQWAELPKVPLQSLRPGDLVVYFPEATHVAVYLGNGTVIHAPRAGGRVKASPIAANPLLGAVRPDPAGRALASYTPPKLPDGATTGPDKGLDAGARKEQDADGQTVGQAKE